MAKLFDGLGTHVKPRLSITVIYKPTLLAYILPLTNEYNSYEQQMNTIGGCPCGS